MPKVTLQHAENIRAITITTEDGKTIRLERDKPVVIAQAEKGLVAAIQRLPIHVQPQPEDDQA